MNPTLLDPHLVMTSLYYETWDRSTLLRSDDAAVTSHIPAGPLGLWDDDTGNRMTTVVLEADLWLVHSTDLSDPEAALHSTEGTATADHDERFDAYASTVIREAVGETLEASRDYPAPLPPDLDRWHCYTTDLGHCIVVVPYPDVLAPSASTSAAIPVHTVQRLGWEVHHGGWVCCWVPLDGEGHPVLDRADIER